MVHGLRPQVLTDGGAKHGTPISMPRVRCEARAFQLEVKRCTLWAKRTLYSLSYVPDRDCSSVAELPAENPELETCIAVTEWL